MHQLHIQLDKNSPLVQLANTQADKVGIGTHLDSHTKIPLKSQYNIQAIILDCKANMPVIEQIQSLLF